MVRPIAILLTLAAACFSAFSQDVPKVQIPQAEKPLYDTDLLPPAFHQKRRDDLRAKMPEGSVAIIFANPVRNRSNDVDFEYHQDPNFYYLTGFREPDAMLVIFKEELVLDSVKTNEIVYVPERNPKQETWTGRRLGTEGVGSKLQIKTARPNSHFADSPIDFSKFSKVLVIPGHDDVRDDKMDRGDLYSLKKHLQEKTTSANMDKRMLYDILARMRQVKHPEELTLMRKAIEITAHSQKELMKALEPDMTEYQSEALIEYFFTRYGAEHEGFPSILGGGENSCVLHYNTNRRKLTKNDLLVVDVGAEYHGYTADVTRTLPVKGTFSPEQKQIYNIVLEAQEAGIKACRAGNKFWDPQTAAHGVIQKRLVELGIIKNPMEAVKYFIHGTSHYLGLDVHDAGLYGPLEPNTVITVEPGIYIPEGSPCDPKWWNIGVRIEDDILITTGEPENLSASAPRKVEEIEALMKEPSLFNVIK